jgi:DNA-binding winged helix-turn-helix (wHTH) protein
VYQAVPEPPEQAGAPVRVVVAIDVPGGRAAAALAARLADDFATNVAELIPGARAHGAVVSPRPVGVVVDLPRRRVTVDGRPLRLAYREFALLAYLATMPHRTMSRSALLDNVWADRFGRESLSVRTVDTHIRRLRAKLGDHAHVLTTVRGRGYRFDPGDDVELRAGEVQKITSAKNLAMS